MEKLGRIEVRGFRSLRDVRLELRDLNVLVGANGSGKSNLIEFLALMRQLVTFDLQLHVTRKGGAHSLFHYGTKHTDSIDAVLEFAPNPRAVQYQCSLGPADPDRVVFFGEQLQSAEPETGIIHESVRSSGMAESSLRIIDTEDESTRKLCEEFAGFVEGMALFHFHDTTPEARIRRTHDLRRRGFLADDGGNLAAFLYRLKSTHPQHYAVIVSTIRFVVPYFTDFVLEPVPENPASILLQWRDRNPDYVFGPHQLSDGSLRAIALVTALLQPDESLPSLIVVDEPELGLHPSAVGVIASLLKAAALKRQVIVATQSPTFLAAFQPEDVVVVERQERPDGRGETTFLRLSDEELGDWVKQYDLGTLYEMNVTGGGPQ